MTPYLTYNGNCREAMQFYCDRLGASLQMMMRIGDAPMADQIPADQHERIMHARIQLNGLVLMASDAMSGFPFEGHKGFSLSLNPTEPAEAERLFAALADGGTVTMPLEKTFWARLFGTVTDRFGVPWMVNCE